MVDDQGFEGKSNLLPFPPIHIVTLAHLARKVNYDKLLTLYLHTTTTNVKAR